MTYTDLLKTIWTAVYDPKADTQQTIEKYFHHRYEQSINGITLNRTEYIQHVMEQKKNMVINTIEYKHVLEKGNELFALYYPKGKNNHNLPIEGEVIIYVRFEGQQILSMHGQVRLIKGELADVDMKNS